MSASPRVAALTFPAPLPILPAMAVATPTITDSIPRWALAWFAVLLLTCVIGWLWWGFDGDRERPLRSSSRTIVNRIQDAVAVLRYNDLGAGEPRDWWNLIPVDRRVHIVFDRYTVLDEMVGYGGRIVVEGGDAEESEVEVDLERALGDRPIVGHWSSDHEQGPDAIRLRLSIGSHPLVVLVEARYNWHGADLNPFKLPATFAEHRLGF
jgi:hypothetical protein